LGDNTRLYYYASLAGCEIASFFQNVSEKIAAIDAAFTLMSESSDKQILMGILTRVQAAG
jgi:hypothetical protein